MKQRAYPGTQAVQRAVRVLKAVSAVRPERGLTELARAVGLNKTTAYRLLTALESEGLVERSPEGEGYRPGPELVALGSRASARPTCASRRAPSSTPSPTRRGRRSRSRSWWAGTPSSSTRPWAGT